MRLVMAAHIKMSAIVAAKELRLSSPVVESMEVLIYLVPLALALGGLGLAGFLWSLKNGQYDDLDGAAWRALGEDDASQP